MGVVTAFLVKSMLFGAIVDDGPDAGQGTDRPPTDTRHFGSATATACREVQAGIYFTTGTEPLLIDDIYDELRLIWKSSQTYELGAEVSLITLKWDDRFEESLVHKASYQPPQKIIAGVTRFVSTDILPYVRDFAMVGIPFTVVVEHYDSHGDFVLRFCSPTPYKFPKGSGIDIGNTSNQDAPFSSVQQIPAPGADEQTMGSGGCELSTSGSAHQTPSSFVWFVGLLLTILALSMRRVT